MERRKYELKENMLQVEQFSEQLSIRVEGKKPKALELYYEKPFIYVSPEGEKKLGFILDIRPKVLKTSDLDLQVSDEELYLFRTAITSDVAWYAPRQCTESKTCKYSKTRVKMLVDVSRKEWSEETGLIKEIFLVIISRDHLDFETGKYHLSKGLGKGYVNIQGGTEGRTTRRVDYKYLDKEYFPSVEFRSKVGKRLQGKSFEVYRENKEGELELLYKEIKRETVDNTVSEKQ